MNLYIDTSALVKLYHYENSSESIRNILEVKKNDLFITISKLSTIEIHSAFLKKIRTNEIGLEDAISVLDYFKLDIEKFNIIPFNDILIDISINLLLRYSEKNNLRSLDSLQLASAIFSNFNSKIDKFICCDKELLEIAKNYFEIINPELV